ncbi:MAG: Rrf2 family transcriptional regulator [Verrucomicrobiota bacterium]
MELSRFTDYSIRFLIFTGTTPEDWITVPQVAHAYAISENHLVKVANSLNKQGYLKAKRGRHGGFQLAQSPQDINVGEIVRQTETLHLVECHRPDGGTCIITGACILKQAVSDARQAFLNKLDEYTLADLLKPQRALKNRFALTA